MFFTNFYLYGINKFGLVKFKGKYLIGVVFDFFNFKVEIFHESLDFLILKSKESSSILISLFTRLLVSKLIPNDTESE